MSQDWPVFTERQLEAWPGAVAEAQHYVDGTITEDHEHWDWEIQWREESRPGRGHAISAIWSDGEYLVQITMDVYGYPAVSVAETRWIHNSADEECDCGPCLLDRDREEAEAVSTQKNPTSVKETTDMGNIESGVADDLRAAVKEMTDRINHATRPTYCCGVCPEMARGGYDCTCLGNPRCKGPVCPDCGHPALDHHGTDGRERRDSGCQTNTMRTDWCRCPLTATEAATHAHARQEA